MNLDGKVAIVTGAGTGVGRATALALAREHCSVIVNYSRSREAAETVAADCQALGVRAEAIQADVAVDDDCRRLVDAATNAWGRLDVLINNAGTTEFIPHADLEKVTTETWNRILSVNVMGPFQCSRAAKAALEADGGGEIVMTSSVAGIAGVGSCIPYAASKAALNNLTVTLARVMGPSIRVNAVAPGFIDGSWLQEGLAGAFDAIKSAMQAKSPLGKVCTPDDVAGAILSLVSGPDLVTGHVLPVEGGMLIGQ
jgi:3-oxoacyl-[acyl-carrier protein] reductase